MTVEPATGAPLPHELVAAEVRAWAGRRQTRQRELSLLLGISQPQVSARWRGDVPFSINDLYALARFWEIKLSDLLEPLEANSEIACSRKTPGHGLDLVVFADEAFGRRHLTLVPPSPAGEDLDDAEVAAVDAGHGVVLTDLSARRSA